jgi:hypothetical protein
MPEYFFIAATETPTYVARSRPCATIDDALRGANFMLGNGAPSVWIVDSYGKVVLPAEQVRLRLKKPMSS